VALKDPRQVVDLVFRLKGVRFPKSDMYWLHFLVDGVPIMMRPLIVQKTSPAEQEEEGKETP